METQPPVKDKNNKVMLALGAVVICAIVLSYVFLLNPSPATSQTGAVVKKIDMISSDSKPETQKIEESLIRLVPNGMYEKNLTYSYHSGNETIDVRVLLKDDVITQASIETVGNAHNVSRKFINGVNAALPDLVIGKKINELDIPKQISGSSLTTAAFKEYLDSLVRE